MRLLLLAGTGEAVRLVAALRDLPDVDVIASLAGITRTPRPLGVATRIGGFGGGAAFAAYLRDEGIGAVLDATHPFAVAISARSARICAELGMPYMQLLRPEWVPQDGDRWTMLAREEDAALHIPTGARVLAVTGRKTLEHYANMAGRVMICRQIDPPEDAFPLAEGYFLPGRPPFSVTEEEETFTRHAIDWLIVRNAGGAASRSKLDAARNLGLPVAMIRRPAQPPGPNVETVAAALAWVRRQV